MATVINNPTNDSGGAGLIIGVIIGALIVMALVMYGFRMIRNPVADNKSETPTNINVTLPSPKILVGTGTAQ